MRKYRKRVTFDNGDTVGISIDPDRVHLFGETGDAVYNPPLRSEEQAKQTEQTLHHRDEATESIVRTGVDYATRQAAPNRQTNQRQPITETR